MTVLTTSRLQLLALSRFQLRRWLTEPARPDQAVGWPVAPGVTNDVVVRAMNSKTRKMAWAPPALHLWYTYWLLLLPTRRLGIGLAGFKGRPDAAGEVEIGYGVAPDYRGHGYATEAVRALLAWALAREGCLAVRALTNKDNTASQRVLLKAGMQLEEEAEQAYVWRVHRQM